MPILMLTARGRPEDVLMGFEAGADDYLPKPFELAILLARAQRAAAPPAMERTQRAARTRHSRTRMPSPGGRSTSRQWKSGWPDRRGVSPRWRCDLLRYLVRNAGQAVARRTILEDVWGLHEGTDTRAIDNFIVRLRRYIEDRPSSPRFLLTVRGVGYRFES